MCKFCPSLSHVTSGRGRPEARHFNRSPSPSSSETTRSFSLLVSRTCGPRAAQCTHQRRQITAQQQCLFQSRKKLFLYVHRLDDYYEGRVCLSVCLFRGHTHRDSPGGSMRGGQRAFRPDNKEDIQLLLKAHHVRACIGQLLPHTQLLPSSQKLGFSLSSRILRTCDSVCRGLGSLIICIHCR